MEDAELGKQPKLKCTSAFPVNRFQESIVCINDIIYQR